jgi:dihydrofolate synthase/folylpolyglutamate synthase
VRAALADVRWPGRFEVVSQAGGHPIVLDGAHTSAAAGVLARAYAAEFPGQPATVLLGLLRDKEPMPIARMLLPIAERFVVVTPPGPRGLPAEELAAAIAPLGIEVKTFPEIARALFEIGDRPIVVTGSLTTVAAAREALGLAQPDPVLPV